MDEGSEGWLGSPGGLARGNLPSWSAGSLSDANSVWRLQPSLFSAWRLRSSLLETVTRLSSRWQWSPAFGRADRHNTRNRGDGIQERAGSVLSRPVAWHPELTRLRARGCFACVHEINTERRGAQGQTGHLNNPGGTSFRFLLEDRRVRWPAMSSVRESSSGYWWRWRRWWWELWRRSLAIALKELESVRYSL